MCALTGKRNKEAHANVKRGMATEREIMIVNKGSKGTHPGYVIQDENGDKRNARLQFHRKKPHFNISAGHGKNKFYIRTGSSELVIGSRHTFKEHSFTVLHRI
jgi:hypothetical protein